MSKRVAEQAQIGPRLSDGCMTPRTEGNYCLTCGSYTCPHAHATYPDRRGEWRP